MDNSGAIVILVLLGIVGLVVAVAVSASIAAKRREEMSAFAAQHGWTYAEEDGSLVDRWEGAPFGRGHSRRALNVLRGEHDGRPLVAFDYRYATTHHNGKTTTTHTHHFSVVTLETGLRVPRLQVLPSSVWRELVDLVTDSDIEVGDAAFDEAFVVHCDDRDSAYDVLAPEVTALTLRHAHQGWQLQDGSLLVISTGKHTPAEVLANLAYLDEVADLVPSFVRRERDAGGTLDGA